MIEPWFVFYFAKVLVGTFLILLDTFVCTFEYFEEHLEREVIRAMPERKHFI